MEIKDMIENDKLVYLTYAVGLAIATILITMNIVTALAGEFLILLIILARFLAGMGLLSTIFLVAVYILKFLPKEYRKKTKGKTTIKIIVAILLIAAIALPTIELYKLITGKTTISTLSLILGIATFIITMYLIPAWKEQKIGPDESTTQTIKQTLGKLAKKIKKGYYYYLTKDYAKAYAIDFIIAKTRLDYYRQKIAKYALPLIAITLLYNPTLTIITIMYYTRLTKDKIKILDNAVLTLTTILGIIYPLTMSTIPLIQLAWTIPYIVGAVIVLALFATTMIDVLVG